MCMANVSGLLALMPEAQFLFPGVLMFPGRSHHLQEEITAKHSDYIK